MKRLINKYYNFRFGLSKEEVELFTLGGKMRIEKKIRRDWEQTIQDLMNANFKSSIFEKYRLMAKNKESSYYGVTDQFLYSALHKYSVEGKSVLIFGSANPWYEAVMIENGAESVDVIEYSDRQSFDSRISYFKPGTVKNKYDVLISISSFEHDGLGRYGDPIKHDADLIAMQDARMFIKDDGIMFFAVPIGLDTICFNQHRVYGKHRLPLMLTNWERIDSFGYEEKDINNSLNSRYGTPYQPIFILKSQ
jgi:hypothetical protein